MPSPSLSSSSGFIHERPTNARTSGVPTPAMIPAPPPTVTAIPLATLIRAASSPSSGDSVTSAVMPLWPNTSAIPLTRSPNSTSRPAP